MGVIYCNPSSPIDGSRNMKSIRVPEEKYLNAFVKWSISAREQVHVRKGDQRYAATLRDPTTAPRVATITAGHVPRGTVGRSPLKGVYGVWLGVKVLLSKAPPRPPPVRFAPLAPMGLDWSVKAQVLEVQMHLSPMGSQKGVEQLAGSRERRGFPEAVACAGLGLLVEGSTSGHP